MRATLLLSREPFLPAVSLRPFFTAPPRHEQQPLSFDQFIVDAE